MFNSDWNPELYLKFNKERIQPSLDLVNRIRLENPGSIIDIGCGPGNSTQVLRRRWPNARITGADNSPAMIRKASEDFPEAKWILLDAAKEVPNEKFDLVFSNATIQWIPDHTQLFNRFMQMVEPGGVLAIQIPDFFNMAFGKALEIVSGFSEWYRFTQDVRSLYTIHDVRFYDDLLSRKSDRHEIWVTDYFHRMEDHTAIIDMMRSTGLKPYLDRLPSDNDGTKFEEMVFTLICKEYPVQDDTKVLFPFRRIFIIGYK